MCYTGTDEAALGPILGPFCAASVSFESSGTPDLTPIADKVNKLYYTDSKVLYSRSKGIEKLERNVLALFYAINGFLPHNAQALLRQVSPANLYSGTAPWFSRLSATGLPRKADTHDIKRSAEKLKSVFADRNIDSVSISAIVIPAEDFNRDLDQSGNKADTVKNFIARLARQSGVSDRKSRQAVFDCQGGRRYYDDWLKDVFPDRDFRAVPGREMEYCSDDQQVLFQIKADAAWLHVAMASMLSKYLREVIMEQFNLYWKGKVPEISETAGYPQDGKRFISDLTAAGISINEINRYIRKK